jgi:hypothetical protein
MPSRFWKASGNALLPGKGFFVPAASGFTTGTAYFASTDSVVYLRTSSGQAQATSFDNGGGQTSDSAATLTAATPVVLIATITPTAVELWVDNVSDGSTALTGTRTTASSRMYIGSLVAAVNFLPGRIYGIVQGSGTLSSTNRANLQTYMAGLHP